MKKRIISFISALTVTIIGSTLTLSFAVDSSNSELWDKFIKYDLCITDYDSLTGEEKELCKFIFETERASYERKDDDVVICERARRMLAGDDVGERITIEQLDGAYGIWDNYADYKSGWQNYIHCVPDIKHIDQSKGYNEYWLDDSGDVRVCFTGEQTIKEYDAFEITGEKAQEFISEHNLQSNEIKAKEIPYGSIFSRYGYEHYPKLDLSEAIEINGDYYYVKSDNTAVFLKCGHCYDKYDRDRQPNIEPHIIADEVNGCPVTAIESCAFHYAPFVEIVLPETIEFIDTWAFAGSNYIEKINFPKGLKYIGQNAIPLMCDKLEIDCPDLVLADQAFSGIFTEAYINAKSIGEAAFAGCYNLKNVTFGENVERIEASTFDYNCPLESIELSPSVKFIGQGAFNFKILKSITIPKTVEVLGALPKAQGSPATSGIYYPPTDPLKDDPVCVFDSDCVINSWYGTEAHFYALENNLTFNPMDDLLYGDANGDGTIGIADGVALQNYILRNGNVGYEADLNKDGRIDSFDMTAMRKKLIEN